MSEDAPTPRWSDRLSDKALAAEIARVHRKHAWLDEARRCVLQGAAMFESLDDRATASDWLWFVRSAYKYRRTVPTLRTQSLAKLADSIDRGQLAEVSGLSRSRIKAIAKEVRRARPDGTTGGRDVEGDGDARDLGDFLHWWLRVVAKYDSAIKLVRKAFGTVERATGDRDIALDVVTMLIVRFERGELLTPSFREMLMAWAVQERRPAAAALAFSEKGKLLDVRDVRDVAAKTMRRMDKPARLWLIERITGGSDLLGLRQRFDERGNPRRAE